ncbi:MAG: acetylornithine/N-succinyldiaminopimelate aminotransferase [Acidobacteriaceae bacterium]|jgi:acetylornithine aminotransferase/acetylornithine/N-succinyldiaminopimelate aminotransferase|nr:acetylornithine/N-succinyldiaminopimelate aminotransferase [Acidobacteriaceae bacterium]
MKLEAIQAAEAKLLLPTYERNPILFVDGAGMHLIDDSGARYLDLLSGIGVNALGYGHPAVVETINRQSRKLVHISNLYFHEGQAELAMRLTERAGMDRAFFCNSGTEAWEAAMKLARAYSAMKRSEGHTLGTKFLALENSFHGRTMGSVSTTHKDKYREPFQPLVPGVEFVRFDDVDQLRASFSNEVCAILIEPVQGEGGIRPVSQEFFAAARELTQSTGALLIADEIQSGLGRTGKWFAYQQFGIRPDITTLAKPLAGGLPLGAMLCTEEASRAIHPGLHGTTFGGGPLACAVAIAVIDAIEQQGLLSNIRETGAYFKGQLHDLAAKHESIVDVRGMGLMLAMEMNSADLAKKIVAKMLERRILINRTSETVLRFLPPFIMGKEHVDLAVSALNEILNEEASGAPSFAAAHQNTGGSLNG